LKPEIEFSDLYKFLASLGVSLIALAILVPIFLLGLSFNIELTQDQIASLPEKAQKFILIRQQMALLFINNWITVSLVLAIFGAILIVIGVYLWQINYQRWQDEIQRVRAAREKREAGIPTPEEMTRLAVDQIYRESSLTADKISSESQLKLANFWELRSRLSYKIKSVFADTHIYQEKAINSHNYIVLQAKKTQQNTSPLIKIQYCDGNNILEDAKNSLATILMDAQLYLRVLQRQPIDWVEGPLATLLLVLPQNLVKALDGKEQEYKQQLTNELSTMLHEANEKLSGKARFHFLFEKEIDALCQFKEQDSQKNLLIGLFFDNLTLSTSSRVQLSLKYRIRSFITSIRRIDLRKIKRTQLAWFAGPISLSIILYFVFTAYQGKYINASNYFLPWLSLIFVIVSTLILFLLLLIARKLWFKTRNHLVGRLTFRNYSTDQEINIPLSSIWNIKKLPRHYLLAFGLENVDNILVESIPNDEDVDQPKIALRIALSDGQQIDSLMKSGSSVAVPFSSWVLEFSAPVSVAETRSRSFIEYLASRWSPIAGVVMIVAVALQIIQLIYDKTWTSSFALDILGITLLATIFAYVAFSKVSFRSKTGKGISLPRFSKLWRRLSLAGMLVLLLGSSFTEYTLYTQQERVSNSTLVVLIAPFNGPEKNYRVTEYIAQQLQESFQEYPDIRIVLLSKAITEQDGVDYARELGNRHQADMVIWGWYGVTVQDVLINMHFELINQNLAFSQTKGYDTVVYKKLASSDFQSFKAQSVISRDLVVYIESVSANLLYQNNQYDVALSRITNALSLETEENFFIDRSTILFLRGNIFSAMSNYDRAISDYSEVISNSPTFANAYLQRGIVYTIVSRYDDALEDLNKAIELDPNPTAYLNRGIVFYHLLKYDEAVTDFTKSLELNPSDSDTYMNRGLAYFALNQNDKAVKDFDAAISLDDNNYVAYVNRGFVYLQLKEYQKAISDMNRAIVLAPQDDDVYVSRGRAYSHVGKYDRALADFNMAIKLNPKSSSAYFNRGLIYKLEGRFDLARADFNKCLEISDNLALEQSAREQLLQLDTPTP
jgi:tetratricopeptide (TPR) repeat protein